MEKELTGRVVKSVAGHDKNKFYVVVRAEGDSVWIADGRARKLESPKRKNIRHIRTTNTVLDLQAVTTDKQLRLALAPFGAARDGAQQEEGRNTCPRQM